MPDFLPFRGTRYRAATGTDAAADDLSRVTAPPYDVIDEEERSVLEATDPHNAVRLILPRPGPDDDAYAHAAATFAGWLAERVLAVDDTPRFYGYRMRYEDDGVDRHTVGVIGALGIGDARGRGDHAVLPHERTMKKARSDRLALLRATRANFDPIWGLSLADGLTDLVPEAPVVATAVDAAGTRHELVPIDDPATIEAISEAVRRAPVVLADGHHRYETARAYREEQGDTPGSNRIMALVVELCDVELCVRPIHRLMNGRLVNGAGAGALRTRLGDAFEIRGAGANTPEGVEHLLARMVAEGGLGIVDRDGLALAVARDDALEPALRDVPEPARDLDATRFDAGMLPHLGEAEISYRDDAATVAALVAKGASGAAVLLRPATVAQIRAAAFEGVRMPQKTTFFYPKPRTGMVFRSLDA